MLSSTHIYHQFIPTKDQLHRRENNGREGKKKNLKMMELARRIKNGKRTVNPGTCVEPARVLNSSPMTQPNLDPKRNEPTRPRSQPARKGKPFRSVPLKNLPSPPSRTTPSSDSPHSSSSADRTISENRSSYVRWYLSVPPLHPIPPTRPISRCHARSRSPPVRS